MVGETATAPQAAAAAYPQAAGGILVSGSVHDAVVGRLPASFEDLGMLRLKNIERPAGKSKYGIGRTLGVFLDMFVLYFFVRYIRQPMRAFGKLALASFLSGASIMTYMVVVAYVSGFPMFRERPGWFLLSAMLMLSGVQIIIAGILAEMLIRIHFGGAGSTTYRVRQSWGTSRRGS